MSALASCYHQSRIMRNLIGGHWPMPAWLRWKLALFAGVLMCGVGIRIALISHFSLAPLLALVAVDGTAALSAWCFAAVTAPRRSRS